MGCQTFAYPDNFSSLLFDWLVNRKNGKVTLAIWFINTAEPLATSGHHEIGRRQNNGYLLLERHTCFMVQQIVLPIKDSNVLKMVQDTLLDSFRAGRSKLHHLSSWKSYTTTGEWCHDVKEIRRLQSWWFGQIYRLYSW